MNYWLKYLNRAKRTARFLSYAPFIRAVLLNGSIVTGSETKESDIDFLIIAKRGRLYTTRFFATFLTGLAGYRRKGKKIKGRICLNCYLSDNKLDISPYDKKSNLKVARAYKYAIPLIDDGISKKFFAKNRWFANYQIEGEQTSIFLATKYYMDFPIVTRRSMERLLNSKAGDWVEKKLMRYQQTRILKGKKRGDEIFADEFEIRLHPHKRRSAG